MIDFVYRNMYWWIGYSSVKIEYSNSSIYYFYLTIHELRQNDVMRK